jgi:hypothetical protein
MNRIKEVFEPPGEEPRGEGRCGDYWVVCAEVGVFIVAPDTAQRIARELERWLTPRWVTFVDLSGSRVRIRGRDVRSSCASTGLQRERDRAFQRARMLEDEADAPPWEDGV